MELTRQNVLGLGWGRGIAFYTQNREKRTIYLLSVYHEFHSRVRRVLQLQSHNEMFTYTHAISIAEAAVQFTTLPPQFISRLIPADGLTREVRTR